MVDGDPGQTGVLVLLHVGMKQEQEHVTVQLGKVMGLPALEVPQEHKLARHQPVTVRMLKSLTNSSPYSLPHFFQLLEIGLHGQLGALVAMLEAVQLVALGCKHKPERAPIRHQQEQAQIVLELFPIHSLATLLHAMVKFVYFN